MAGFGDGDSEDDDVSGYFWEGKWKEREDEEGRGFYGELGGQGKRHSMVSLGR